MSVPLNARPRPGTRPAPGATLADHDRQVPAASPRRIIVGVTAGIAAYKAAELVRLFVQAGREVRVVMTAGARAFVGEVTFQALSGHPVRSDVLDPAAEAAMSHIELARWADAVVVAPATADFLARAARGGAEDLLTTTLLATAAPVFLAPAMNQQMWRAPAVARNLEMLRADGRHVLGPGEGAQACGDVGPGRMLEPGAILAAVLGTGANAGPLAGLSVLVSAGPTEEPIDPVRYLSNRSSGKMGYAVAAAARDAGAEVTLVSGPVALAAPAGVRVVPIRTAQQMFEAVLEAVPRHDVYVGAAAVADYAPEPAPAKLKKDATARELLLTPTPDIIRAVAAHPSRPFTVGFAAETGEVERYAREKLKDKGLDMIAANLVGDGIGFGSEHNTLVVMTDDARHDLGRDRKERLAEQLVALIGRHYDAARPRAAARAAAAPD